MRDDAALNGIIHNLDPNTTFAIVYETYSNAWEIPFIAVKEHIERGNPAVVCNYAKPVERLLRELELVGFDVRKALKGDSFFIIDIFGSRYNLRVNLPNVFYIDSVDPETLMPKIALVFQERILPKVKGKFLLRLLQPLHGLVSLSGEEPAIKMFSNMITLSSRLGVKSSIMLTLNQDTVSRNFTAWTVELSDYVLLSKVFVGKGRIEEHLYFLKAPITDFKPEEFVLTKTGKKGRERFSLRKVRELSP